jgi:hypothetical protein
VDLVPDEQLAQAIDLGEFLTMEDARRSVILLLRHG